MSIFELLFSLLAQTYPNLVLITNFGELRRFVLFVCFACLLLFLARESPLSTCRCGVVPTTSSSLPLAPRSPVLRPCQVSTELSAEETSAGPKVAVESALSNRLMNQVLQEKEALLGLPASFLSRPRHQLILQKRVFLRDAYTLK